MSLTVAQLIKELSQLPQDSIVLVSSDSEGNYIRDLDDSIFVGCAEEVDPGEWNLISEEDEPVESAPEVVALFPV